MTGNAHPEGLSPASTSLDDIDKAESDNPRCAVRPTSSVGITLPDWPLDVVLVLVENCPHSTLAALARTCKALHGYLIPTLYKDLNLSYASLTSWGPGHGWKAEYCQNATIRYLLLHPHVATHIKRFHFTLGKLSGLQSQLRCFRMLNLLETVKEVDIDGTVLLYSRALRETLSDQLFPNVKTIKIRDPIIFQFVEKVLLGCEKPFLETVELWSLVFSVPPELLGDDYKRKKDIVELYFGSLLSWRARALKSFIHLGKNVGFVRAPEDAQRNMSLPELRKVGEKILGKA